MESELSSLMWGYEERIHGVAASDALVALSGLVTLLQQARHDLRMQTLGPVNVAVSHGMVFDYFDEIRKIIELAKQDLLFVDPYLDAEFISRYLPQVPVGVNTRLLARESHDRYLLVDRNACYQSGASFKDGARSAPTTLTQITDAFGAMLTTYEDLWSHSTIVR